MERRVCTKCFESHPITFFNKDRTKSDGVYPQCRNCTRAACKRVYKKYHEKHIQLKRTWKDANRQRHREINRRWQKENLDRCRETTARYRERLKQATPDWVDLDEIKAIREACPPGWHVDHIYPLAGENACGLNVPWNLQYLPPEVHWAKGTKMPAAQEAWSHL